MKKKRTNVQLVKDYFNTFVVLYLLMFMIFIFGPAEIYFSNSSQFDFLYEDFAINFLLQSLLVTAITAFVINILPLFLRNVLTAIIFGCSLAGYLQIMFFNEDLQLLGENPERYHPSSEKALINTLLWIFIFLSFIILMLIKTKLGKTIITYVSVCLLIVQLVAFGSLFMNAEQSCFERMPEGEAYLSGEKQFYISKNKNIIVFVLDYFSNEYLDSALVQYPDLLEDYSDFTYYDNADCTYFGTFPSLAHMLSGNELDNSISINDWFVDIWKQEKTVNFYQEMKDRNYVTNVYTIDDNFLVGTAEVNQIDNLFDNITTEGQDLTVNEGLLKSVMLRLSCYRFFPSVLKLHMYVDANEYENIVQLKEDGIRHYNYAFYSDLKEKGLTIDKSGKNYYVFQHLMGPHIFDTGEDGMMKEDATREETVKGCMVIVADYLNRLKELGKYDDATVIITSDHGADRDSQMIFFVKEPGEHHEKTRVNSAPISHTDFLPTIAKAAGIEYGKYGRAISDIKEDEERLRTVWIRGWDDTCGTVRRYCSEEDGSYNCFRGYSYCGNRDALYDVFDQGIYETVPVVDAYY